MRLHINYVLIKELNIKNLVEKYQILNI